MKRRYFLLAGAAVAGTAGALVVGCGAPPLQGRVGKPGSWPAPEGQVGLNAWVQIAADGRVTVAVPRSEMGQGVHTALAMLVAEELEADWAMVATAPSPIHRIYANTALLLNVLPLQSGADGWVADLVRGSAQRLGHVLSLQVTGGSSSVRDAWAPMRLAGACARQMLLQAAARRWAVPVGECRAAQGRVQHAASGRSAGYGELAADAAQLPVPEGLALKDAKDFKLLGQPLPRQDIPAKVNGQAVFGIDVRLPGLLHAAIRQCPVFGGQLKSFDAAAVLKRRGVKQVFALGEAAVVVVADNPWRAETAVAALPIQWADGPNAALDSAAISAQLRHHVTEKPGFSFRNEGEASKVLARAQAQGEPCIEADYEVPFLAHAPMEPINCVAQVAGGQVTLWASTQVPSLVRWKAAQVAGVSQDDVTVNVTLLGGGFGRRLETDMAEQAVAIAQRCNGAPVKLLWSRSEDLQHDMYRPAAVARFDAALGADGLPTAWLNHVAAPSLGLDTFKRLLPSLAADSPDKNHIEGAFDLPYAIPHLGVRQHRVATPVPVGSWRSVGHSYNAFFTECFIDELAHAAGQDPVVYRLALLKQHPRHAAVLKLAAEKAGWGQPLPAGHARGVAVHESFGSWVAEVAEVSLVAGQPRVHRVVCAVDCGSVVNPDTVKAQMEGSIVFGLTAALYGRITLKAGRVEQTNFPDQRLLTLAEMPQVEVHIVPSTAPPGGVGEPGTPPIAPAVANALRVLTGQPVRRLPLVLPLPTPPAG